MLFVSGLHAGRERVLDAGGQYEASECAVEGAFSAWHGEGTPCANVLVMVEQHSR